MAIGSLQTNKTWVQLINEVVDEFRKWGIERHDIILPKKNPEDGVVTIQFLWRDEWKPISCSIFRFERDGAKRNLCALREAIRSARLAEQRGIGQVLADMANLMALPDPNDPYVILGVQPGSDIARIKSAYHSRLMTAHPDKGGSREQYDRVRAAADKLGVAL